MMLQYVRGGKAVFDSTYAEESPRSPEDEAAFRVWSAERKAADVATITALMNQKG